MELGNPIRLRRYEVKYRKLKGYKYQLVEPVFENLPAPFGGVCIHGKFFKICDRQLAAWDDYAWDGASGPAIDTKNFLRASLVHDVLYQCMRQGRMTRDLRIEADRLLRQMCLEAGMSKFRAWYVYKSVRMFGKKATFNGVEKWERIYEV
jgi:hypothetical protein